MLICHPFCAEEREEEVGDRVETVIRLWCKERATNETVCVDVEGFHGWFYVEAEGRSVAFQNSLDDAYIDLATELKEKFKELLLQIAFVKRFKLYYFSNATTQHKMLKIKCATTATLKRVISFITFRKGNKTHFRVWEPPNLISVTRRFLSSISCTPSGWMRIEKVSENAFPSPPSPPSPPSQLAAFGKAAEDAQSRESGEGGEGGEGGEVKDSEESEKAETEKGKKGKRSETEKGEKSRARKAVRTKSPSIKADVAEGVSSPSILSFDLEAYSSNHLAMPSAENPKDAIFMASLVFEDGKGGARQRVLVTMKDVNDFGSAIKVIKTESEVELLREIGKQIGLFDPDIIIGYNTHTFDYAYHDTRFKILRGGSTEGKWPTGWSRGEDPVFLSQMSWKSSAYGVNNPKAPKVSGRLLIDLMTVIKRDYKLERYSLDFVSRHFLSEEGGKHDITPKQMFEAFENEDVELMSRVGLYCVRDSDLVIDLFARLNYWIGLRELSNVAGVMMEDTFSRGQQVRIVSLLYDLCQAENIVIDQPLKKDRRDEEEEEEKYKGAFVVEPIVGVHDNVICLDFASLYPSIMMAYNLSFDTFVPNGQTKVKCHEILVDAEEEEAQKTERTQQKLNFAKTRGGQEVQTQKSPQKCVFVHQDVRKGLLPRLLSRLIQERKNVRARMRSISDPLQLTVLDKRQNGLKIISNSTYGFLGAKRVGMLPLVEAALSVTSKGREMIKQVNEWIQQKYDGKVIYGDTDSTMFVIPSLISSPAQCDAIGKRLSEELSSLFPPPIKLEYEKSMKILCLKKKKYAALLINPDGSYKKELLRRGIVLARRDNCAWHRELYEQLIHAILDNQTEKHCVSLVQTHIEKALKGEVSREKFVIVKELNDHYISDGATMNVFAKELQKLGRPALPGSRLDFVIVGNCVSDRSKASTNQGLLGTRMRLFDMWKEAGFEPPLDLAYYVSNVLKNSVDQLFEVAFQTEKEKCPVRLIEKQMVKEAMGKGSQKITSFFQGTR